MGQVTVGLDYQYEGLFESFPEHFRTRVDRADESYDMSHNL